MKRISRRSLSIGFVSCIGAPLAACSEMRAPISRKARIASSGNQDAASNGAYVWIAAFASALKEAGFETQEFPNSALGKEQNRTELQQLGLIQVNMASSSEIGNYSHLLSGLNLPFLFADYDQLDALLTRTDFVESVNLELGKHGLLLGDVAYLGGMGGIFNSKREISTIDDLKGLRIRAMEASELIYLNKWGVSSTQIAWEEVSQALQTGIVDGYVNPPQTPILFGQTKQLHYFTDLKLKPSVRVVVLSGKWFGSLSDVEKDAVRRAISKARAVNRRWATEAVEAGKRLLEDRGIRVTKLRSAAREVFVTRTREAYPQIAEPETVRRLLGYVDRLQADR